jgi:hypothetical protein
MPGFSKNYMVYLLVACFSFLFHFLVSQDNNLNPTILRTGINRC